MILCGIGIFCQRACADLDIISQSEATVRKVILGTAGLDGSQKIVGVGINRRKCQIGIGGSRSRCHAVHGVVGIIGLGCGGIFRILDPLQYVGEAIN